MKYSQKKSSENERLNQLREMLISVSDSYDYFVLGVIADCKRSKKKYPEKCSNITEQIIAYIEEHPKAKSSEIIEYTSNCCGLPWGDDEGVWHIDGMRLLQKNKQSKSSKVSIATTDA